MSSKPTVVLFLPEHIARQMFKPQQLERLSAAANVLGPLMPTDNDRFTSALAQANTLITGWRTPPIDGSILKLAPNAKLIAHSAGSVKTLVSDAVYDHGTVAGFGREDRRVIRVPRCRKHSNVSSNDSRLRRSPDKT